MLTSMGWEELITVMPGVRSGKPCVRGTRITVQDVPAASSPSNPAPWCARHTTHTIRPIRFGAPPSLNPPR